MRASEKLTDPHQFSSTCIAASVCPLLRERSPYPFRKVRAATKLLVAAWYGVGSAGRRSLQRLRIHAASSAETSPVWPRGHSFHRGNTATPTWTCLASRSVSTSDYADRLLSVEKKFSNVETPRCPCPPQAPEALPHALHHLVAAYAISVDEREI